MMLLGVHQRFQAARDASPLPMAMLIRIESSIGSGREVDCGLEGMWKAGARGWRLGPGAVTR